MRHVTIAVLLGLALSSSAHATDANEHPLAGAFGGLVQERDVDLVFGYLREALGAAIVGREAPPPDELRQRAEAIGDEMKRRGAAAARAVIDSIERSVREGAREPTRPALPPSSTYQRI